MSGGGRRPPRPGMVPGGGMGQGWVPGVNMPPLGYGLVAQQPHMAAPQPHMAPHQPLMAPQQAWQQQQQQHFMAQQAGLAVGPMGVATLTQQQQQQQQQQQFPQHLQQQWMEAQRRAAEEQRKYYDQMMKQRQFDEQKMRLKAFSASKKTGVSADTMIESILGVKEAPKQRSPQPVKKGGGAEEQGGHPAAAPTSQAQTPRQGTAVDWKKLENVNSLFASPKKTITSTTTTTTTPAEHPVHQIQDTTSNAGLPVPNANLPAPNNTAPQAPVQPVAPLGMGDVTAGGRKEGKSPVILPQWLKDLSTVPEVYKRAVGLVVGTEGWVDTSRAYMLLMKTALPPPLLGVLWEMVNCTAPGQLTQEEFLALLALVALVQSGQPITGPDVLAATTEPLLPLMDHPALAPLVQDYLQSKQKQQAENNIATTQQANDDDEFDDFVSVTVTSSSTVPPQVPSVASQGFTAPAQAAPQPAGTGVWPPVTAATAQKPEIPQVDKNKAMNLPKLGLSPEPSPTASFDDDFDDFQSASLPTAPQGSAVNSGVSTTSTITTTSTPAAPTVLQPEKPGMAEDKYAAFREITGLSTQETTGGNEGESADDSFGEFCSSEVASLSLAQSTSSTLPSLLQCQSASGTSNTSPISFEVYSTPPEALPDTQTFEADFSSAFAPKQPDNYADIHEAMKRAEEEQKRKEESRWSDPFGEFEEAAPPAGLSAPPASGSNGSGGSLPPPPALSVPWLKVGIGGEEEEEDEDFGDFMGPTEGGGGVSGGSQSLPPHLENLGETQSVASLELPGLEMTVGVEASDTLGLGSNHSPDLFLQPRSDVGCLEDQFGGLSLDPTPAPAGGARGSSGGMNNNNSSSSLAPQHSTSGPAGSVIDSYCSSGGLVDKYSIIREEASRDTQPPGEAHTGSWERCLEGSVKLLEEAHGILSSLALPASLKSQVLATTQMQDYLANVQEVWLVCGRIGSSSRRVTTSTRVDELLSQARTLWEDILAGAENAIAKPETDSSSDENDNQMGEGEVCGVCLTGGGNRLTYGGHSYHPPCANLWLNCVDLLLPSLTPVTLL